MTEKNIPSNESMGWLSCQKLYSLDYFLADMIATELSNKFVIINLFTRCVGNIIGVDNEVVLFLFCICLGNDGDGFGLYLDDLNVICLLLFACFHECLESFLFNIYFMIFN